jgi:ketol-acid reductoisomerase
MAAKMYYEADADPSIIRGRKVAIIGYGSQGQAHALNLKESGVPVVVGLREGSKSAAKAEAAGLEVMDIAAASKWANVIMLTMPDTEQKATYEEFIKPHMRKGKALAFAHGFNIRFKRIRPPKTVDVIMIAPKGPAISCAAPTPRAAACRASSPCTRTPRWRHGVGAELRRGDRRGACRRHRDDLQRGDRDRSVRRTGRVVRRPDVARAGRFRDARRGRIPAEMAYFECLHEVKLIVDLMYEEGIAGMRYSISDTAEYGDVTRGPRIVNTRTKAEMKKILREIQSGKFAKEWVAESETGVRTSMPCASRVPTTRSKRSAGGCGR